jgi:hypothetical protein
VKTPEQVLLDIARRVRTTWAATLTGTGDQSAWPHAFPLGEPTSAELGADSAAMVAKVAAWRDWEAGHHLPLRYRARRVLGTNQELPTHLAVPDLDTAAGLCGGDWPARIARARQRSTVLAHRYPHLIQADRTLAAVEPLSDVDFDLLCRAADWFATHDATGLTPRQVPIEGLHAKWLNTRQQLVRTLAGIHELGLLPPHPARIHFTYLDPDYRAAGGRVHDAATVGDRVRLPYLPRVLVISENKDTAIHFPQLPGGICVEGAGAGGSAVAAFDWITDAAHLFYWGDMDADGLEVLDGFRGAGVPAAAILMNPGSYAQWERFGTNLDRHGKPLEPRPPAAVAQLTADERALYEHLASPACPGHRRIEQERIPLTVALEAVLLAVQAHPVA